MQILLGNELLALKLLFLSANAQPVDFWFWLHFLKAIVDRVSWIWHGNELLVPESVL